MSIIINLVHRFNIIPGKIPEDLSVEMDKLILKLYGTPINSSSPKDTEEPGMLQSMGSQRGGHNLATE